MDGADGQTGGKNRSISFGLSALISFGLFNVFQQKTVVGFPARLFFLVIHRVRFKNNLQKKYISIQCGVKLILMVS
jgi:hypothetical protein